MPSKKTIDEEGQKNGDTDRHANARMQGKRGNQKQKSKKTNFLRNIKREVSWLIFPILWLGRWVYRLEPIEKFTAVLCIVGGFQGWAFIESERSLIAPNAMVLIPGPILTPDNALAVRIEIKNGGKIEAHILRGLVKLASPISPLPSIPDYSGQETEYGAVVLPETTVFLTAVPLPGGQPIKVTDTDVTNVNSKLMNIWVYGYFVYEDRYSIFGSKKTGFCFHYQPGNDPKVGMFEACGNNAYVYSP